MEEAQPGLSLGLLSEKMVIALGRAVRGEPQGGADEEVFRAARDLFHLMRSDEVVVVGRSPAARMFNDVGYYDALHVVEHEAHDGGAEQVAQEYEELLTRLIEGRAHEDDLEHLKSLRRLFVEVGEMTLARAHDISRASEEVTWRPAARPTSRF